MTNLRVDAVDLFTEKINPENRNQYLFNGGWKDIVSHNEIIRIKGGKQDTVDIRFTHRGPIISGLMNLDDISQKIKWLGYEFLNGLNDFSDISLSMKWTGYDTSEEVRTIYLLNRAAGWDDFRSGLKTFRSISRNFVYADTEGNIGLKAAGGIPLRKGDGIILRNGETGEYDWQGYVPFDKLPFVFNPEDGEVSSANNRTVADAEADALTAMTGWDYDMNPALTAPTIFEFFRISFKRNLLADELGDLYDSMWETSGD